MKKSYLLLVIMTMGVTINAKHMGQRAQLSVEEVQKRKLARQQVLARKPVYKMLDALLTDETIHGWTIKSQIDWSSVFHIIDSMKDVISVNEYATPDYEQYTLLDLASEKNNLLAAKTLLEKYKANPNGGDMTPLMIACEKGNIPMVNLLLEHGGNPSKKDPLGKTSFDYARNHPEVLKVLNIFKTIGSSQTSAAAA